MFRHLMDSHVLDLFLLSPYISRPSSIFRLPIVSLIFSGFPFRLCCARARGLLFCLFCLFSFLVPFSLLYVFQMGSQRLKITPKRSATITVRLSTPHEPVYIYIFFCILVPSLSLVCFVSVISHACYMLCQCERVGRQTRLRVDPHILNFVPSYLIFCLCVYAPSCSLTPSFLFLRASHNVQNQEFFFARLYS